MASARGSIDAGGGSFIGFRAPPDIKTALAKAARFHGTDQSTLIRAWLADRLGAEGFGDFGEGEDDHDGTDQTGDGGIHEARA